MPESKSVNLIDGFTSIRAVRRQRDGAKGPRTPAAPGRAARGKKAQPKPAEPGKPGARIGRTAIPKKFEIVCYDCGYSFTMPGKLADTYCPKCRIELKVTDYVIDSVWAQDLRTIGTIEVKPKAVIDSGELQARHIILAGSVKDGRIRALKLLELCPGALFDPAKIETQDLLVRAGGRFTIAGKVACRNVEISGEFTATVFTEGTVTVHPGGFLGGEVHSPRLIIEDGAEMKANVFLGVKTDRKGRG